MEYKTTEETTGTELTPASERMLSVEQARAIKEVEGAIVSAKRFPRNSTAAYNRIMDACKRKTFAEHAMYAYKRGGSLVSGPSIRMAEMLAQNYGNIGTGIVELETRDGESQMQAYCIDYETNYQKRITFSVPHVRDTKDGKTALKSSRDVYENNFNMGHRRLRNCILAVIPSDFVEDAAKMVEKTLAGDASIPLVDRARQMVAAFGKIGVSQEMIEKRIGHKVDSIIEHELVLLRKTYKALEDGMTSISNEFDTGATAEGGKATTLQERLKQNGTANKEEKIAAKTETKEAPKPDPKKTAKAADDGPEAAEDQTNFDNYQGGKVGASETDKRGK